MDKGEKFQVPDLKIFIMTNRSPETYGPKT